MAGNLEDPTQWRLSTPGGIPIKSEGISGSFEKDSGEVTWRILCEANQIFNLLIEIFPPPLIFGFVAIPVVFPLPGVFGLYARRMQFKSLQDDMPIDPFSSDLTAPEGTYFPVIRVDIEFGPLDIKNPNPNDPFTFLEISGTSTGEFLHTPITSVLEQEETLDDPTEEEEAEAAKKPTWVPEESTNPPNPNTGEVPDSNELEPEENTDPNVPITVLVPQTEWSLKWNQIPFDIYRDVLAHRLKFLIGRVNDATFPVLFNAPKETLLFSGFSYSQQVTWRDGLIDTPPVTVDLKIVEKIVVQDGVRIGHNHMWRPGKGWTRLLIDGQKAIYETANFGFLFQL